METQLGKYQTMHVKATFPTGHITVELLQTPVVNKWIEVFNNYKALNIPSVLHTNWIAPWGHDWHKQNSQSEALINKRADAVKKINDAIDNANSLIDGEKFPYRAYEGMPWMHTNRIHRCFTTSSFKWDPDRMWLHSLTHEQLLQCKTMGTNELKDFMYDNSLPQFKVLDFEKFNWEIHVINHQVHEYEDASHSIVAEETLKDLTAIDNIPHKNRRKHIMWNKEYTYTADKTCIDPKFWSEDFLTTISYEQMIASFPDNYEECNVMVHKSIGGKDYETCYAQYDDALEADIRNIEHINGNMTFYFNNDHHKFYLGTRFYQWAKSYGLRDEIFLPVPIGKIVDCTVDINPPFVPDEPVQSVELF